MPGYGERRKPMEKEIPTTYRFPTTHRLPGGMNELEMLLSSGGRKECLYPIIPTLVCKLSTRNRRELHGCETRTFGSGLQNAYANYVYAII